jgi:hypothetical protein
MAERYSKPFTVLVQGVPQAEISSIQVKTSSGDKPVYTLLAGLAGFSDGPASCEITGKGAIPLAGYETDFAELCRMHVDRTFSIREANVVAQVKGRFMDVTSNSEVENPNGVDFSFTGKILSRRTI